MTPQSNNNYYDVDSSTRAVATMCLSPPNLSTSAIPVANIAPNAPLSTAAVMVELAPGVQIQLRGSEETQKAINTGFYIQCECMLCSVSDVSASNHSSGNEIYCILDCDYFICPTCRSVQPNPISTNSNVPTDVSNGDTRYPGGLGLGFRMES